MLKLKLHTDFFDYYDHWFDIEGDVFERFTRTTRSRRDDFRLLLSAGFIVPWHGKLKRFTELDKDICVVVYDDEYAHAGEGKRLIKVADATEDDMNKFCSMYVPAAVSYHIRFLSIGKQWIVLQYTSDHEWASNVGNVDIQLLFYARELVEGRMLKLQKLLNTPLVAVDGRWSEKGQFIAFDLNTAPMLKGTGIEDLIPTKEVVESIKEFYTSE